MNYLLLVLFSGMLIAAELPAPMPSLPPDGRSLQLEVQSPTRDQAGEVDPKGLAEDILALKRAVERVRAATLTSSDAASDTATKHNGPLPSAGEMSMHSSKTLVPEGERRASPRLGERLTLQRLVGGGALLNCSLERETLEVVYREIGILVGMPIDDTQVVGGRRTVSVNLSDIPWDEAFDRILGQGGIAWRAEGKGAVKTLVLSERDRLGGMAVLERLAARALEQAAQSKDPVASSEALWLLGQQQYAAKRWVEAMRLWANVADRFGQSKEAIARRWVMKSIKGVGDAMMRLQQYNEARSVYANYVSRVTEDVDPDLAEVYLSCADAGRHQGMLHNDPLSFDQAVDMLHAMLEKFANKPEAAAEVHLARLALGQLLVDAGRWREAETQLSLFAKAGVGEEGPPADQLTFWRAECAFNIGRQDEARTAYERLYRAWRAAKGEMTLPQHLYQTAALRIGQCYMQEKEPRWVHALFAFLRARQDFIQTSMGPEIAVAIARCYAELNRDEDSVAVLWQLIKQDARDPRPGRMQLDQLLGELEGGLASYPGPIRARVLFYIAQAEYRNAQRDRKVRVAMAEAAMNHYERVMAENPGPELVNAARLGMARAALFAGQDARGVAMLVGLLRENTMDTRDRAVAAQLLGTHYREQGKLREAIKAFRGEVE